MSAVTDESTGGESREPIRVRLPGFLQEDVGLGDAIKRATSLVGIKPCISCQERARLLNQRVVFSSGRRP